MKERTRQSQLNTSRVCLLAAALKLADYVAGAKYRVYKVQTEFVEFNGSTYFVEECRGFRTRVAECPVNNRPAALVAKPGGSYGAYWREKAHVVNNIAISDAGNGYQWIYPRDNHRPFEFRALAGHALTGEHCILFQGTLPVSIKMD